MTYTFLEIKGVKYAFTEYLLDSLVDGLVLQQTGDDSFSFHSPYGDCHVEGVSMERFIDIINLSKYEKLIDILIDNGIKREDLPMFKRNHVS
jgi:hypothetical protein